MGRRVGGGTEAPKEIRSSGGVGVPSRQKVVVTTSRERGGSETPSGKGSGRKQKTLTRAGQRWLARRARLRFEMVRGHHALDAQ